MTLVNTRVQVDHPEVLDESVRMLLMQFSFSNPEIVPACLLKRTAETVPEYIDRKTAPITGQQFIIKTWRTDIFQLSAYGLGLAKYVLVGGFSQECPHKDSRQGTYFSVRFLFAREEFARESSEFEKVRDDVCFALDQICIEAYWRVRAYRNPFFEDRKLVEGAYAMSVNFEVREPRFGSNSDPIKVWPKDSVTGEKDKTGFKIPLPPENYLLVRDNAIVIESAT